jgi:beta-mannanase
MTARRLSPLLACAALAACAAPDRVTAPVARAAAAPSTAIAPPPNAVASGVAIDGAPTGRAGMSAWDAWTSLVGRRALYVMWFTDWSSKFQGYAVANAYSRNATPVITWEMKNRQAAIPYADVLAGKWNAYIDGWAAAAKADGRPLFLRFGHEMNGNWYGWSGAKNGASAEAATRFIATWRYVHGRFAAAGVTNVTWVWCPNHESVPAATWNTPESYYPGDAYVDWTCADGYNWGTSQTMATSGWDSRWQTFDELFGPVYRRVTALAPTKPFMIGEFASSELGGDKAAWITDAAARIASTDYPQLRAFVWFNYNKETDWRVESSAAATRAFKSAFVAGPRIAWQ